MGHSLGGINCRRYAVAHSRDVLGMVFVDSANENEIPRTWQVFRQVKGREPTSEEKQLLGDEELDFEGMSEQARQKRWEADIPLIVLTRDSPKPSPKSEMGTRMEALREELQADLVGRSKFAEQRVILGAGHDIQLDNPRAVINAIRDILERTSQKKN